MPKKTKKSPAKKLGAIRIISGKWRGKRLPVHDAEGLRPTTDRIKETLFNWLIADIAQARVLDLFSGAGSLGFEALSRYASYVLLCEKHHSTAKQLKQNLIELKTNDADVQCLDSLSMLSQPCKQGFDIIFIDPPFNLNLIQPCIEKIEENQWANDQALIYIETERDFIWNKPSEHWELLKEKTTGQVTYQLWRYHADISHHSI